MRVGQCRYINKMDIGTLTKKSKALLIPDMIREREVAASPCKWTQSRPNITDLGEKDSSPSWPTGELSKNYLFGNKDVCCHPTTSKSAVLSSMQKVRMQCQNVTSEVPRVRTSVAQSSSQSTPNLHCLRRRGRELKSRRPPLKTSKEIWRLDSIQSRRTFLRLALLLHAGTETRD